ncbi:hypothetical protein MMC14_000424 [Varicellaria rhodocarpa]|nr:hypothetical protein [Varicellaria rhodocarpa]
MDTHQRVEHDKSEPNPDADPTQRKIFPPPDLKRHCNQHARKSKRVNAARSDSASPESPLIIPETPEFKDKRRLIDTTPSPELPSIIPETPGREEERRLRDATPSPELPSIIPETPGVEEARRMRSPAPSSEIPAMVPKTPGVEEERRLRNAESDEETMDGYHQFPSSEL